MVVFVGADGAQGDSEGVRVQHIFGGGQGRDMGCIFSTLMNEHVKSKNEPIIR